MVFSEADEKRLEALKVSLEQARAGTHSRIVQEEKRLRSVKGSKFGKVESLRDFRLAIVQTTFEKVKSEAEDEYHREKGNVQDKLVQDVIDRQRRHTKVEAPELRAVTRKMRNARGEAVSAPATAKGKREAKMAAAAIPLRQGEVEEDFEAMATAVHNLAPHLEIDLEIEVAPSKRGRPVEPVRSRGMPEPSGPKRKRADFDFKGKSRAEVSGARITVWYEEELNGRKVDVPYQGVVNSCDPREGLYVKFEGSPEEMLITNEDDWRWGAHSRKPPESSRK